MEEHDGCLIFMDMDNLKQINDIYGHKAGDRALKVFGSILASQESETAACRLGGDEFLLFVPDISSDASAQLVKNIFTRFQAAKASDPEIRNASMSAGLCMTLRGQAFADCYVKADKALYYVKQNGKENFFFYQQMEQENLAQGGTGKDLAAVARALQESGTYNGALNLGLPGVCQAVCLHKPAQRALFVSLLSGNDHHEYHSGCGPVHRKPGAGTGQHGSGHPPEYPGCRYLHPV